MDRRSFLKNSAAASALMTVPLASKVASAGKKSNSLIFASPGTPQSLDSEFDTSLGTFDFISACYDSLIAYDTMPDPKDPDAKREDLKKYPFIKGQSPKMLTTHFVCELVQELFA